MTDLSPAAQSVLHAYGNCIGGVDAMMGSERRGLVAALRAAADQLFPEPDDWTKDNMSEQGLWLLRLKRDQLLAIAAELEGADG